MAAKLHAGFLAAFSLLLVVKLIEAGKPLEMWLRINGHELKDGAVKKQDGANVKFDLSTLFDAKAKCIDVKDSDLKELCPTQSAFETMLSNIQQIMERADKKVAFPNKDKVMNANVKKFLDCKRKEIEKLLPDQGKVEKLEDEFSKLTWLFELIPVCGAADFRRRVGAHMVRKFRKVCGAACKVGVDPDLSEEQERELEAQILGATMVDANGIDKGTLITIPPRTHHHFRKNFAHKSVLSLDSLTKNFFAEAKYKRVALWLGHTSYYQDEQKLHDSIKAELGKADFNKDVIHIGLLRNRGVGLLNDAARKVWPDAKTRTDAKVAIGGVTAVKQLDLDRFDKVDWDWWSGHDFSIFYDQMNAAYDNAKDKTFHVELIRAAVKAGKEVHVIAYEGGHFTAADLKGVLTDAELKIKVKMVLHMGWQKEKPAQDGQGDAATKLCNEAKKTLDKKLTAVPIATTVQVALDENWFNAKPQSKARNYVPNGCSDDAEFKNDYVLPDLDKAACEKCFDGGNGKDEAKPLEEKLAKPESVDEKTKKVTPATPAIPMKKGTYELLTEKLGRSYKYHAEFVPHFFENNAARGGDKYERMVQWTGYSADYSESLLFYQALEKVIIREKFYENTIHVGPVTWMGIGAVNHILGRMRRETFLGTAKHKVKNIALGGLCSTLALEAIHADVWGLYAWTKQDFVMFFPKPKGVGDWDYTVAYNAAEYKLKTPIKNILGVMTDKQTGDSRTADVVIHAAGFGLTSYHVAFEGGNQARDEFLNILERVKLVRATVSRVDPPADKKTMAEKDQLYLDDEKRRDNVVAKAKTDMHLGWQKTDPTDKSADSAVNSIAQSILELGFAAKSEAVTNDRDELIKNGLCKEVLGAPCGQVACYSKYNCQCSNKDDPKIPSATFYINNGEHTKRFRGEKPHMDDSVKYCLVQTRDAAGNRYEPFDMQTNQLLRKSAKMADMIWADHKAEDAKLFMTHLKEVSAKN